jgi:hypothetical protein
MTRLIYLSSLCILLTAFGGCKKDNYSKSIAGVWELREQAGSIRIAYAKGNGNLLKFNNSNYEIYTDGKLTKSGVYMLIPDTAVQQNVCAGLSNKEYKNRIVFDGKEVETKKFIKISTNELNLVSGCFALDAGSSSLFEKQ